MITKEQKETIITLASSKKEPEVATYLVLNGVETENSYSLPDFKKLGSLDIPEGDYTQLSLIVDEEEGDSVQLEAETVTELEGLAKEVQGLLK